MRGTGGEGRRSYNRGLHLSMRQSGWRFPPERRDALKAADRNEWLPPEPILRAAGVGAGETAIDVGAGTGFWTEPLARLVGPTGRVIAVDVEPIMLDEIRTLAAGRGLTNVEVVQSGDSIPLDDSIADLVVLGFVLHEPSDLDAFLAEVVRLLKPAGRVLVIEWEDHPTESGPPLEYRVSAEEARALLYAVGLSVERIKSPTDDAYILLAGEFHPGDPQMTMPTA
jgi:ubiquinone/menaquinone biosynthesis C-methylase UbiE